MCPHWCVHTGASTLQGQNGSHMLNPRCVAKEAEPGQCIVPQSLGKYAETPVFLFQSTYDLANLRNPMVIEPDCESNPKCKWRMAWQSMASQQRMPAYRSIVEHLYRWKLRPPPHYPFKPWSEDVTA